MGEIKCPDCGKEQADTNKFCKNCGSNLQNVKKEVPELNLNTALKEDSAPEKKVDLNTSISEEKKPELNGSAGNETADKPKENRKICSKCGHELKNEKFCPRCGQSTASIVPYEPKSESKEKTCPSCGTKITVEKFCPNCGCKIDGIAKQTYNAPQKYCKNCGNPIDPKAEICPKCGVRQMAVVEQKNPVLALVLSFIFPGIGQFYNNQNRKGILLVVAYIVSFILVSIFIGLLLMMLIWIFGMYDAYSTAKAINSGEYLEDKFF